MEGPTITRNAMIAFGDGCVISEGSPGTVLAEAREYHLASPAETVLCFETATGRQVEFNLEEPLEKLVSDARSHGIGTLDPGGSRGRGRPRLGVVGREVTLLPRHWEWLDRQPGGASASLRRIVEQARKSEPPDKRRKEQLDVLGRIMWSVAGDYPGFEEASRALYRQDRERFVGLLQSWPEPVAGYFSRRVGEILATN